MTKVLLIEDETHIAEGLRLNLEMEGYECYLAKNGVDGLDLYNSMRCDIVILDLMLPKLSGEHVLKSIRDVDEDIPILVLSAKDIQGSKNNCFKNGVDDYLTKPFDLEELLLRVKSLLKRSAKLSITEDFSFGPNKVCLKTGAGKTEKGPIRLTDQETKLLKFFFENQGVPVSRQRIIKDAMGYNSDMSTRTVDNFIVRFRKYFEKDPKNPIYFRSLRSVGYFFDKESNDGGIT